MLKNIIGYNKLFEVYHGGHIAGRNIIQGSGNDPTATIVLGIVLLGIIILVIYIRKKYKQQKYFK